MALAPASDSKPSTSSTTPSTPAPSASPNQAGNADSLEAAGAGQPGVRGSAGMSGSSAGSGETMQAGNASTAPAQQALSDAQTLIPDASWTCGMPDGIPGPLKGQAVFNIDFAVGKVHDVGRTQYGQRVQIDVTGGSITGPKLEAKLLDRGLDYQLTLDNGVVELEQLHIFEVGDASVYMRNCGVAPGPGNVRVVLDFEAPNASDVEWLNTGTYVGIREFDAQAMTLRMKVYQVEGPVDPTDAVRIIEPQGDIDQSWSCALAAGSQGDVVYTETVGIASSVPVGDSKRGTRNIIPITGGKTEGKIKGGVLSGGADYQLIASGGFELDARYTLETDDGELIIVRNCGQITGLVPTFEARMDGSYSWLNSKTFLSSSPTPSTDAVNLTIYETR
jgi:hypothetical protein